MYLLKIIASIIKDFQKTDNIGVSIISSIIVLAAAILGVVFQSMSL